MAAFSYSVKELNVDLLEMDVFLTLDEHVVVFHDHDMQRLTGVTGNIADFLYADLPPLRLRPEFLEDPLIAGDPAATKIPTLEEVFSAFPSVPAHIELKT